MTHIPVTQNSAHAHPWQMQQKHADAHGDEAHQGQRNGCFDSTLRITIELTSRQRKAQHHGERGGAGLGIDRERAHKRGDRGEHRHDGVAQWVENGTEKHVVAFVKPHGCTADKYCKFLQHSSSIACREWRPRLQPAASYYQPRALR